MKDTWWNVLILFYDCIVVHGMNVPGYVFKIVLYWLRETFPVILSKLLVHMAWPGAAKGRMPVQRLGGPQVQIMNGIGLDGSEWQRQRAELVEPHARWRSLAKGHLCLICHSPDGPHLKQRHWPSFILGWEKVSAEAQWEDQMFLTLSGKRLKGVRR